jgi:Cof subfamily protein (haloacid dehalogenase superfamily)
VSDSGPAGCPGTVAGLLAIDVDGTLITDHGAITDTVYGSLERVVAAGWEIIIATGRTLYAARHVIESLPFVRYALFSNGSTILDIRGGNIILLERIPADVVGEVVRVFRSHGAVPVLYSADIYNQKMYYDTTEGACEYFVWFVGNDLRATRVDDIMEFAGDVQQIGTIAPRETVNRIRADLAGGRATAMSLPFESTHFGGKNHEFWFLQVIGEGISKRGAIRRLAKMLAVPSGRIVAVGDNYNDADMIEGADVGVAMGNAPDEIKRLAKVVVGTNNDSGLAEVVERVIFSGEYF